MSAQPPNSQLLVSSADVAVVSCLTALYLWATRAFFVDSERRFENRHWGPPNYEVALFFPTPETEDAFFAKAQALLPPESWSWTRMPD